MRSPEELDTVDWPSLRHAYGNADDVPGWIRDLYSGDPEQAHKAMYEFFGKALHQGSVSSAAVAAVPFLAHAAVHGVHERASVLAALAGTGGPEAEPEFEDEVQGCMRVAEEVAGLLHLLRDDDPQIRRNMVRVARRATGATVPAALRELTACFESDSSPAVRAEALTVLTRLDPDARAVDGRLRSALTDPVPAVRAAAAVDLLERAKAPYPAEVVAVLAEAGGDPEFSVNSGEFAPGIGTVDSRLWELAEDADALTAVARSWIARGDHQIRGSRRAQRLSEVWRDRENETIGLLTAALAHDHAPWDLFTLLDAIAKWLPGASQPDPVLGDRLLPHARTERQAQELLGHLGDQRLLTDIPDPRPEALAALAARTQHPDHQRLALRHPDGCGLDELYPALSPEVARTHLPDLIHLLRRRPTPTLLRCFGDWAIHDTGLLDALETLARTADDNTLAIAAAVTAARLGTDPHPALRLLEQQLSDTGRHLEEAARLGPAAAPLLPLIERHLDNGTTRYRLHAAQTHVNITGDPSVAAPVLTALLDPMGPVGVHALQALRRIEPPYPQHLRPQLLHWATSERRLMSEYTTWVSGRRQHLDDQLRETARQMLT
ncbi:HEAT repeat domain-containing protein [Kitasatospora sp. NPDC018058]|uniref:HEAT repeat domain-containing protein n=1 Tax=Kitasatospora sp. NPDC018058 TaxID=3364025 RepID=UPI0037BF1BE2